MLLVFGCFFFKQTPRSEGKTLPVSYSPMKMAPIAQRVWQITEDANVNQRNSGSKYFSQLLC